MCVCLAAGPSAPRRPTVWAAATVTHASVGARRPPAKAEGTVARPSAEGVTVARPSAQRVSSQRRAAAVAEVRNAELLRAERQGLLTVEGMYIYICIFVCVLFTGNATGIKIIHCLHFLFVYVYLLKLCVPMSFFYPLHYVSRVRVPCL